MRNLSFMTGTTCIAIEPETILKAKDRGIRKVYDLYSPISG